MNFSDFKHWLGAEPYSREPDFLAARNSAPEFENAAREAEAFEHKLEAAMQVQTPAGLLEDILALSRTTDQSASVTPINKNRRQSPWFMALAASVFVAVGAASVLFWQQQHYANLEDYVQKHMSHDGGQVLALAAGANGHAAGVSMQQVRQVLEPFKTTVNEDLLGQISFIKTCPTPDGDGAHFVISTPDGPVTVIFMPETITTGVAEFTVDGQRAHVVPLKHGSIAIIGSNDNQIQAIIPLLKEGIRPLTADI